MPCHVILCIKNEMRIAELRREVKVKKVIKAKKKTVVKIEIEVTRVVKFKSKNELFTIIGLVSDGYSSTIPLLDTCTCIYH